MNKFFTFLRNLFQIKEETYDPMKFLIAGLGNIGDKYANTRHNIGFNVVDFLAESKDGQWKTESLGDVCEIKHKGRTLVLLKPSTFMNRSGKSVRYWLEKKKIPKDNLLVVVDDLNLDFGKMKMRSKGSDGGHNGLKDLQQQLGGNNYARLRFGIGDDYKKGQQVDFVLGKWDAEERDKLPKLVKKASQGCLDFATIGLKFTMETFNRK